MKDLKARFLLFVAVVVGVCISGCVAIAQSEMGVPLLDPIDPSYAPLINGLVGLLLQYPIVATAVFAIGSLRVIFKPMQLFIDGIVARTETKEDDRIWAAVKASKVYRSVSWLIDMMSSIKLPQAKKKATPPAQ